MVKIPEKYFSYFKKVGTVKVYRKRQIIYLQNDSADALYLILSGRVRVFNTTVTGKETTLEIVEKGRIFGESSFLGEYRRPTTVEAVNTVTLVSCSIENLIPILKESEELMMLMFQHLSQTCDYLANKVYRLTNYNRYQRIANFLLEETACSNPDKDITEDGIPYTHEEIAGLLGLSRVTVSKVLASFMEKGMIKNGYRKILILDRKALQKECERKEKK
ncbi:Crp/Fnr family transcriptional regulator [Sellimonas sp.]|uniref:Crp/Fnr family transcriptional regulator n=1 Tax=Sellimonas sp. TaxID=2021466 RepID=UPI00257BBF43|nr:Crp/Fnr family transcriptional regulator [Sellimonas sp.]